MTSRELDNLVRSGLLKPEPGNQVEFDGLVDSGQNRLADAKRADLSPESRFDLAYSAAHALSLAAMRWHGYRPAKRYAVFQSLGHTLGIAAQTWRVLDKSHAIRNAIEYEGASNVDRQLLVDLIKATDIVLSAVAKLGPASPTGRAAKPRS